MIGYRREAVRVKVMKYEGLHPLEHRKFSVDPQITSFEVLQSLLAKAFEIRGDFTVCYRVNDDYGQENYLPLLSDWDLDAAFFSASEPYLCLRVDMKPFEESSDDWECPDPVQPSAEAKQSYRLQGLIMNQVERTFNMMQRAFNLSEESAQQQISQPPRPPLTDAEFRTFLDPIGGVIHRQQLREVIYNGGIEPSLRKVVWKHILNVYPEGMSGKERIEYMKKKALEYEALRDSWRQMIKKGQMVGDLAYVTGMVRKDVLRTDRHHMFYAGSDDNKNIASLFNILTTYALNHPAVSYCQGMSDLASPLLVTMNDEAHAYICFCALMQRLAPNFLLDGIMMTQRFQHLADGLLYYDPQFYNYLRSHQADDLLFCYRWLLLEMKREFAFEDALRILEVMWSSISLPPPQEELRLVEQQFCLSPPAASPRPRENPYTKMCALRRGANHSLDECQRHKKPSITKPFSSLDDSQLRQPDHPDTSPNKSFRVVKNLNEFLSFDKRLKRESQLMEGGTKEQQNSPDCATEYFPMTTSMTRELRLELENLDRHVFGREDVFVWENPLLIASTPDEVNGGEIFTTDRQSIKSITPIRLVKREDAKTETKVKSLLSRRKVSLKELNAMTNGSVGSATTCQEAVELNSGDAVTRTGNMSGLPSPKDFGGGNPFLMFLCISVLCQHRELIMRSGMDYNEMAMHFDKMVRKHDAIRVLNQARTMYAAYLKQHRSGSSGTEFSV